MPQPALFVIDDDPGVVHALRDDLDRRFREDLRQISEFLAEWATDQEGGFDLFHVIGRLQDRSTHELRALLTRFNVPYHFHAADSEQGRRLLEIKGLDTSRLPLVIRHDDYTRVE